MSLLAGSVLLIVVALYQAVNAAALKQTGVPFIANEGQIDHPDVAFYSQDHYGDTFITKSGEITYRLLPDSGKQGWVLKEWLAGGDPSEVQGLDSENTPEIHFLSASSIAGTDHSTLPTHTSSP